MEGKSTYFKGNQFINNTIDKIIPQARRDLLLGFCYCLFVLGLGFVSDFALVNSFDLISSDGRNSSPRSGGNSPFYPITPNDLPTLIKDALTGSLLGDGYFGFSNTVNGLGKGNARFAFTQKNFEYIMWLWQDILNCLCTATKPRGWPQVKPTQYTFSTRAFPALTVLHSLWYHFDQLTHHYIKVIPSNIGAMLKPLGLAIWIMDDGYWQHSSNTVYLCTECFTEAEVNLLIRVLFDNLDRKSVV